MASGYFTMSTLGTIPEAREEEDFFAKPSTPTKGNPKQFTPMFNASSLESLASSGPEGFKNRKVQVRDGFLVVSESSEHEESTCTSVMADMMDDWENVYLKHRDDIIDKDGFIFTPLHIVKKLAESMEEEIKIEHFVLQNPDKKGAGTVYRVDIMIGALRGVTSVGQCTRKQLARQVAAIDIYEKILLQEHELGLRKAPSQRVATLPGWRVDTLMIASLFNEICNERNLELPTFEMVLPPGNKLGKFTAICRLGNQEIIGESDFPWLAKKLAAKAMYEKITGNDFPLESTPVGRDVLGLPQMRLLGYKPTITPMKRKWILDHHVRNCQVVFPPNEPNDGDMDDIEEEALQSQAKKSKVAKPITMRETLKITVGTCAGTSRQVSKSTTVESLPVASTSRAAQISVEDQELQKPADESDDELAEEQVHQLEGDEYANVEDDDEDKLVICVDEQEELDLLLG